MTAYSPTNQPISLLHAHKLYFHTNIVHTEPTDTDTLYMVMAMEELKVCDGKRIDGMCVLCSSDGDELKKSLSELADKNHHSKSISRISSGSNPFLDIAHDPNAAVYKTGFLTRKIHADMDGKKSKSSEVLACFRMFSV